MGIEPNESLDLRSIQRMTADQLTDHILVDTRSDHCYTSSYFGDLFDWEFFYDAIVLLHVGRYEPIIGGLSLFLDHQQPNGFIPRCIPLGRADDAYGQLEAGEHCKPFLAQSAVRLYDKVGSLDWMPDEGLPRLESYLRHWFVDRDTRGAGLSTWRSAPHSGADTQWMRAGRWQADMCEGTDLNAYIVKECQALARLAAASGDAALEGRARSWAEERGAAIQRHLWNETLGFYLDRDATTGEPIPVMTGAGFLPLWAGISSRQQVERLVTEHLQSAAEFWSPYPICSLSRQHPSYTQTYRATAENGFFLDDNHANWNGGWWPHWQYPIIMGLKRYGFDELAHELASVFARLVATQGTCEWYDAESGRGHGIEPFWAGASAIGAFIFEELEGADLG